MGLSALAMLLLLVTGLLCSCYAKKAEDDNLISRVRKCAIFPPPAAASKASDTSGRSSSASFLLSGSLASSGCPTNHQLCSGTCIELGRPSGKCQGTNNAKCGCD
ncbi:unnamed protein product [Ixodes persulcatus]